MNAIGTALSGIRAATLRLDASANNIANANSTGPTPASANQSGAQVYQPLSVQQSPLQNGGVSAQVVRSDKPAVPTYDPASPYPTFSK